jgi:acyl-CoA dehydrogenase
MILFNPKKFRGEHLDGRSRELILKTIDFFEKMGKNKLKENDRKMTWYEDFLEFQKNEKIFYTFLTPPQYADDPNARWDTWRICDYNEVLAFYSLAYWYTWQVTILGLGPIWMSKNEKIKKEVAEMLKNGGVFAFGLSEREHGADIYATETKLIPQPDGTWKAYGRKYYIGNANVASIISTFARFADPDGSLPYDMDKKRFAFFALRRDERYYQLIKNIVASQMFVGDFLIHEYPVSEDDILEKGEDAWDAALNTVNVGKFNLGWASIGICTHALYEAINHASKRILYGMHVTDFPHVKRLFVDAYCRLVAMKLFARRACDYMRVASLNDRRYLLYNAIVKSKVTREGEEVINLLWDVIAAKGFEKDTYFEMAARYIRALPKLEGTVHVNMALILKFLYNYLFNPAEFSDVPKMDVVKHDEFLFNQGPAVGLERVRFHDYHKAYNSIELPNVNVFKEQIETFREMIANASPSFEQMRDFDFLASLGELFTLLVYGHLIIEAKHVYIGLYDVSDELLDQIFEVFVRDFSKFAVELMAKPTTTEEQLNYCRKMVKRPVPSKDRFEKVLEEVYSLKDAYEMNP